MATNSQVAEGPLIKQIPGGYAEFLQKESGLPPARLVTDEGEWWAKLVHKPTLDTPVDPPIDTTTTDDTGGQAFTDDEMQGMDEQAFHDKLRDELNRADTTAEQVDLGPLYEDTSSYWKPDTTDYSYKLPDFLTEQHGIVTGGSGGQLYTPPKIFPTTPKAPTRPKVPDGIADRFQQGRGPLDVGKPLDEFEAQPTQPKSDWRFYDPNTQNAVEGSVKDGLGFLDRSIRSIAGPAAIEFKPRNEKEAELHRQFKRGYETFKSWLEETGGVFGCELYETGGGRTTTKDPRTGEVQAAHFPNLPKTLVNIITGKTDPVVMQKYGDIHWITIAATIGMANTYGPIVWAIPGLKTMAKTIGASINGALLDKPNLDGNIIQDATHTAFWVLGKTGQKMWDISLGKIAEKVRGRPKTDRDETLEEKFERNLLGIKDTFKDQPQQRVKITVDPDRKGSPHLQPKQTRYSPGGGEPQMPVPDDPWYVRPNPRQHDRGQERGEPGKSFVPPPPVGQTTSPVVVQAPQGEQQTETYGGTSPTQQRDPEQLDAKTITGGPMGQPVGRIETDQLTQEQLDAGPQIGQKITEEEAAEIAEQITGEAPEGEPVHTIKGDYKPKTDAEIPEPTVTKPPRLDTPIIPKTLEDPIGEFPKGELPETDHLTKEQLEAKPDITQIEEDLPEVKPETLKELEIEPEEKPTEPYATYTVPVRVPVSKDGRQLNPDDPNEMEDYDRMIMLPMEFPNRGKDDPQEGSEQAEYSRKMDQIESEQQIKKEDEEWRKQQETDPTDIGQTDPHDFRSDQQKELGLTAGNQWVDESDRSTWPAIAATQTPQYNQKTGQWDLMYNQNLPQSNIPDHPQYYGNNPESHLNVKPDVNVEYTPKEDPRDWSTSDVRVEKAARDAGMQYTERVEFISPDGEAMFVELPVRIFKDAIGFSYGIDYDASTQYGVPWNWQPRYIQGRVGFDPGE